MRTKSRVNPRGGVQGGSVAPGAVLACLALSWSLGACSAAGTSSGTTDPVFAIRGAGACEPDESPATLPDPRELVDTAALSPELRALARSEEAEGEAVLTLWYQTDGVNMRRDVIAHTLTPFFADSLQALVFSQLRRQAEAEEDWGVRLVIGLGDDVRYEVQRRQICAPAPRDPELESTMATFFSTGSRYRGGRRERVVVLLVSVHPAGYVSDAKIVRGASSGSSLERELFQYVRQFSFEPATIDGIPVPGQAYVPVRIGAD